MATENPKHNTYTEWAYACWSLVSMPPTIDFAGLEALCEALDIDYTPYNLKLILDAAMEKDADND